MIRDIIYIELKTGYSDDGPSMDWICENFKKLRKPFTLMTMLFRNIMVVIQTM